MSNLQAVIRAIDELSTDDLRQLYNHIIETRGQYLTPPSEETAPPTASRILGLHAHLGQTWMSDDFHNELPDSFWLGEE